MFGIRTVTDEDIRTFQAHGFVCKLLATAKAAEDGVCAFIEPTWLPAMTWRLPCPKTSTSSPTMGRKSASTASLAKVPGAILSLQRCGGLPGHPGGQARLLHGCHAPYRCYQQHGEGHPYYVRTACPDEFLQSVTAERWESGIVTACVSVADMLRWGRGS